MSFWSENYSFIKDVYDTRVSKMIEWMDHVEMAIQKVIRRCHCKNRLSNWNLDFHQSSLFSHCRWWQPRCTRAPSSSESETTSSPWSRTWRKPTQRSGWMRSRKPFSGQKWHRFHVGVFWVASWWCCIKNNSQWIPRGNFHLINFQGPRRWREEGRVLAPRGRDRKAPGFDSPGAGDSSEKRGEQTFPKNSPLANKLTTVEILKCQVMWATWSEFSSGNILGNVASHLVIQIDVSDKSEAAAGTQGLYLALTNNTFTTFHATRPKCKSIKNRWFTAFYTPVVL